jgi:hypothetical protein
VRAIPSGASVLVVSRGDAGLLELVGCRAAHFPQDPAGRYAGQYPAESKDAIDHLESLRRGGAEYLVFPDTARWWLDYYPGLAAHLMSRYRPVVDEPDSCVIFSLETGGSDGDELRSDFAAARHDQGVRQLRELLQSLLPRNAAIAVVTGGDPSLLDLGYDARHFPLIEDGIDHVAPDDPALGSRLRDLARSGTDYLILPRVAFESLAAYDAAKARIGDRCEPLIRQRHLGAIFSLRRLIREGQWVD